MKKFFAAVPFLFAVGAASAATTTADPLITVDRVTTTGTFSGAPGLLKDGQFNGLNGDWVWNNTHTVNWTAAGSGTRVKFVFDDVYTLTDIALSVSANDGYKIQYSLNNETWTELLTFNLHGGTNRLKTVSSTGVGIGTTDTDLDFTSVQAKYVRIFATAGVSQTTGQFSLGEVQFFGTAAAVPEPASTALFLAGLGAMGLLSRRRKTQD